MPSGICARAAAGGPMVTLAGGPMVTLAGGPMVTLAGGPIVTLAGGPTVRPTGGAAAAPQMDISRLAETALSNWHLVMALLLSGLEKNQPYAAAHVRAGICEAYHSVTAEPPMGRKGP